jgi:hypothetical protein
METAEIMNLTVDNLYRPEKKHIYNLDGKLSDHSQGNQGTCHQSNLMVVIWMRHIPSESPPF